MLGIEIYDDCFLTCIILMARPLNTGLPHNFTPFIGGQLLVLLVIDGPKHSCPQTSAAQVVLDRFGFEGIHIGCRA